MPPTDYREGNPAALRVALCQIYTEEWAVEANLRRTLEALAEAHRQGAELAITPECVLHGYGFAEPGALTARMAEVAEITDGPSLCAVRARARDLRLEVVLGFAERGKAGRYHNSAAHIGPDGALIGVYRKVHCRRFESADGEGVFTPGDRFEVLARSCRQGTFRIGTMICFDREVAESARCLRALGAELIVCPLATNTYDLFHPSAQADNEMITRCRAAENEVFIAVVNHAGRFNGGSFLVGPGGEPICQLGEGPEVRTLDVPVGVIAALCHADPWGWMGWGYRRPEVYAPLLGPPVGVKEKP